MNTPNEPAAVIVAPRPPPALFASVRTSRDLTLAAFAGALLVAFALQAGAFLPRFSAHDGAAAASAQAPVECTSAPAVVAHEDREPVTTPRG